MELTYRGLRVMDAKRRSRLLTSMSEHGQQSPVWVVKNEGVGGERYVLIDGYLRVSVLERLGQDKVDALVLPLDEAGALCWTLVQRGNERRSTLEEAWVLKELVERHGQREVDLAKRLDRSVSWISRRLGLVRVLPESVQHQVQQGKLCPYGAERHLVPLARAKRGDCERLVAELGSSKVSARELGRLVSAWRSATPKEQERLLAKPRLYLRAQEAAAAVAKEGPRECEEPSLERRLRKDLESLEALARAARRRLNQVGEGSLGLPLMLQAVWEQAFGAFEQLQRSMEERLHAGA